jgi:hypothetical protein
MEVVPVSAEEYLPHIVRAAEASGYAGLMVVLARTADARAQHEELTRDWTSLHDVTGSLLAVLCPDPDASRHLSAVAGGPLGRAAAAPGLYLEHQSWQRKASFQRNFWNENARYSFSRSRATQTADAHHSAWTEAVSRCARYFGVAEAQLPAVLILSFWDETAVLIRIHPTISIYRLAKALAESFDNALRRIEQIDSKIESLEESRRETRANESSWTSQNRTLLRWSAKIEGIECQLAQSKELDPSLVARCQAGLRRVRETGEVESLPDDLRSLHRQLISQNLRWPLRHSAVWGLIRELGGRKTVPVQRSSPYPAQLEKLSREIGGMGSLKTALRGDMNLAKGIVAACRQLFNYVAIAESHGNAALKDWDLIVVDRTARGALKTVNVRA